MALLNRLFPLFWQVMRFGIIGVIAACVHFGIVVSLVEHANIAPLIANIIAFGLAVQISYWGHRSFTFQANDVAHRIAFPKLLSVYLLALAANEALYYCFMTVFEMPYTLALFFVLAIMACATFVVNKLWVFG